MYVCMNIYYIYIYIYTNTYTGRSEAAKGDASDRALFSTGDALNNSSLQILNRHQR